MNPVEPKAENLAPGWQRVVYAENQPDYLPLPSLQELKPRMGTMNMSPERVVSVWEPDEGELALLKAMLDSHANGGPRPRVSLMSHVYGQPLQPIRMTVGEFSDPYRVPGPPDPPKNRYRPVG